MTMEPGTKTRLTTAFVLLLVLVAGSILGVAIDRRLDARTAMREGAGPETSGSVEGEEGTGEGAVDSSRRRRLIVEQVGLSETQKTRVDSIVAHYRQEMRTLQDEVQREIQEAYSPRYRELLSETRSDIMSVLTPEQQVAYDSLLVEHDRRRTERRSRETPPDSGAVGGEE